MVKLTNYQKAQLCHYHCFGEFSYKKKVAASAWRKMINALLDQNLLQNVNGNFVVSKKGKMWVNENHLKIDTSILRRNK